MIMERAALAAPTGNSRTTMRSHGTGRVPGDAPGTASRIAGKPWSLPIAQSTTLERVDCAIDTVGMAPERVDCAIDTVGTASERVDCAIGMPQRPAGTSRGGPGRPRPPAWRGIWREATNGRRETSSGAASDLRAAYGKVNSGAPEPWRYPRLAS